MLKHDFSSLKQLVETTLHSRMVYKKAMVIYDLPQLFSPVQRAWAFWVTTNMGYSSKIGSWAFDYNGKCERKMQTKIEEFTDIYSERLKHVCIESRDACEVIEARDRENVFFYIDPPYVDSNQGHYAGYTQEHFNRLLLVLSSCTGKFLLSSYPNDSLTSFVNKYGWYQKEINMTLCASNTKSKKKVEALTANYPI